MEGLNRACLLGNLGSDPELRHTQGGKAVLKFRLATTETVPGRDGGERKEYTQWHSVCVWGPRAEGLAKILGKGERVYVEGRIETRSYDDKDGVKRSITEISANTVILCGGKRDGARAQPRPTPQPDRDEVPPPDDGGSGDGDSDDVPF